MPSTEVRRWIAASALIGFGQQVWVVFRNQLLHDLGLPASVLGVVQGSGAAAGVLAGVAGLWLLSRRSAESLLRVGAFANAAGFAAQVVATRPWQFVLGAVVAGVGIQMLTMASGPFLARRVGDRDRVWTYALQVVAIQTLPGALGAVLGGEIQRSVAAGGASAVDGHRAALLVGAAAVAAALGPLQGIGGSGSPLRDGGSTPLHAPLLAWALAADALVFFGAGLAVPFLQVYLRAVYGAPPHRVGWYFAATMVAGTVANLAASRLARAAGERRLLVLLQVATAASYAGLACASAERGAASALVARAACAVSAAPLWTALLHARLRPGEGDATAAWRMVFQSVAWASANLLAGVALARGPEALRDLLYVAAGVQLLATWGCRRGLEALSSREP